MSTQGYNFGGDDTPGPDDQLGALQDVIQDLHTLVSILTDPQATQVASQCLTALTRVQATMMSAQQGSPQQAIAQRLTGAGAGGGPGY
jgi:hypothetical protein